MRNFQTAAIAVFIIGLFISLSSITAYVVHETLYSISLSSAGKEWVAADEGDHFPSSREWWNVDAFLRTADGMQWGLTASFEYEQETPACNQFLTLFNLTSGASYSLGSYGDPLGALVHAKNRVELHYGQSWMAGAYPHYDVHFNRHNISATLHFKAVVPPRYVADSISNALLPMGLGYYVYGFIPRCLVWGTLTVDDHMTAVYGTGYYEHVWGNWTYSNPFQGTADTNKVLSAYLRLARWWASHRSSPLPRSIGFSSDNNMFGYDWIWAAFDNGWSMFYGNIPFWVYDGPAFGVLYLISNTGEYYEFSDISYTYDALAYEPEHDIYYPTAITLRARNQGQELVLACHMACDVHTYLDTNLSSPYWEAIYLWESPGPISGWFNDSITTVSLQGICEIEPERQASVLGHHRFAFDLHSPAQNFGLSIEAVSHFFNMGIGIDLYLCPTPSLRIRTGR